MTNLNEGPIKLQFIYATDIANVLHDESDKIGSSCASIVIDVLSTLAKLGYKIVPLSKNDFDITDGNSVVHKAYQYAISELSAKGHMKYQDYLNMLPEDVFDKDEHEPQSQEHIYHISQENYDKQFDYQTKVISSLVEDINSYKNLNKGPI